MVTKFCTNNDICYILTNPPNRNHAKQLPSNDPNLILTLKPLVIKIDQILRQNIKYFSCWAADDSKRRESESLWCDGSGFRFSETVNTDAAVNAGRWMVTKVQHAAVYGSQRTWSVNLKAEPWIPPAEYHTHSWGFISRVIADGGLGVAAANPEVCCIIAEFV